MTFSIVARCERTGQLGVAVSTAVPAVGAMCPYARSGVGAVSTQSWVNPYLAMRALDRIAAGDDAIEALNAVIAQDAEKHLRQIGVIDSMGRASAWTGDECTPWCGQIVDTNFAAQGNMLVSAATIDAMADSFRSSRALDLAERLVQALEAGQRAGGDKRGRQSACIKVYGAEDYALWDLRVDEHVDPIIELRRVYAIARAQLLPFIEGMPSKHGDAKRLPESVTQMLLRSPANR